MFLPQNFRNRKFETLQNPSIIPVTWNPEYPASPWGTGYYYLEGRFNGGFFALPVWGAYIWRSLYMEGLIFGILRYLSSDVERVERTQVDLATRWAQFFSQARRERVVDFLCFLRQKQARERELGPTTGTGNEKRRTLRENSSGKRTRPISLLKYSHLQIFEQEIEIARMSDRKNKERKQK